nr:hypothetical protein JVH1_1623 [Rhodococcus sp. JVH1]
MIAEKLAATSWPLFRAEAIARSTIFAKSSQREYAVAACN